MVSQPRLRMALIGLGRLGALRAKILAFEQPRIELVAVCDTKPGAEQWAAENLPASIKFFADPDKCMRDSGAQAVLISTATATHAPLICRALDLELVRCRPPLRFCMGMMLTSFAPARDVRKANFGRHCRHAGGRREVSIQASSEVLASIFAEV